MIVKKKLPSLLSFISPLPFPFSFPNIVFSSANPY